ncbi:hypothetical protein [Vibrio cholerae]|uniref:hypothetical protein n=1 Tax=Vibrio cholerae TaxID=666 RepID=UPI003C6F014D
MDAKELNHMIAEAYSRDLQKPELVSFKEVSRWGRKYGFPVVCTLADESEEKQIHWAASLLIQVARYLAARRYAGIAHTGTGLRAVQRCDAVIGEWAWSSKSIALTAQTLSISGLHGRFFV